MKKKGAEWLATSARSPPLRGRFRSGPRSVRPLRSVRSSAAALRLVRARASSPFVVRRSSFARRCSRRVPPGRRGAPPFGRVPFSGVPPPRAVARLPRSLPLSSLLSPARVLLSPRARRPSSLSSLRALSPRRPSLQPPLRSGGCASTASHSAPFFFIMLIFVKKKINLSAFPRICVRCSLDFPYLWALFNSLIFTSLWQKVICFSVCPAVPLVT